MPTKTQDRHPRYPQSSSASRTCARIEQATAAYLAGIGDLGLLAKESRSLQSELAAAEAERDTLLARADTASAVELAKSFVSDLSPAGWSIPDVPAVMPAWRERWRTMEPVARRRLLRGLHGSIQLTPADPQRSGRIDFNGAPLGIFHEFATTTHTKETPA